MLDSLVSSALLLVCVFALSWWLTGRLRQYALARQLIDIPNARSSHVVPTPRGGGVAIVAAFMLALPLLLWLHLIDVRLVVAIAGGGGLVAIVGFMDDHGHIAARWRLLAHFLAAAWVLFWLDVNPATGMGVAVSVTLMGIAAIYLVWMLNLYNFMDGIDGIASVEAISVCGLGAGSFWLANDTSLAGLTLALGAAVGGFLVWNAPPARIFMGDAGSGCLGFVLGVIGLQAWNVDAVFFWSWVVLLAVFVTDATVTLVHRAIRGERIYQAHRSHAYQRFARRLGGHAPVTLGVGVINFFFLFPVAGLVATRTLSVPWGLAAAYVPIIALALYGGAGAPESSDVR